VYTSIDRGCGARWVRRKISHGIPIAPWSEERNTEDFSQRRVCTGEAVDMAMEDDLCWRMAQRAVLMASV